MDGFFETRIVKKTLPKAISLCDSDLSLYFVSENLKLCGVCLSYLCKLYFTDSTQGRSYR